MQSIDLTTIWEQALLADKIMERHGEELDIKPARLEEDRKLIGANPRLICVASTGMADRFIPVNPTNQNICPEATWEEWTRLAKAIIEEHETPVATVEQEAR